MSGIRSGIRDEIRTILREELAALMAETRGAEVETVRIASSSDLDAFARNLMERVSRPGFVDKVQRGEIRFVLETTPSCAPPGPAVAAASMVTGTPRVAAEVIDKPLVTEADIAALGAGTVRLPRDSRMTPLAKDEARRKGIRIKRIEA